MKKRQRTHQTILHAAWELFAQYGYENTTTRQIAQRANVADGTVFSHFPTKLDLLRQGMLGQLRDIGHGLNDNDTLSTAQDFISLITPYYQYYFDHICLSQALLKEVIWDLDYYKEMDSQLIDTMEHSPNVLVKLPLLMDSYFMTLIRHLSKPCPNLNAALDDLSAKVRQILGSQ
ncbi:TetR/AcrR family transcriptional regulator [Vibrio ostreicida]|uniref:Helix-turn-helix domain-containing protein n=1 Tax=Vibrio ostreicida TaxID=526588 RepID=A0ABT8BZK7_9VIBR|nr:TetR/AcrR family transcriptional regulator [Vibrio ostreicida]MDN3611811.1 helix-turn-helix domain-containing protein [Vibrio ostreicida]MDN3612656.1 helix-turn-helix domain-containing protein [Vibrio ostreicida]MDN3612682.1 helix-turn-helix domain-containing protein [Vibrio ostreicida]NPD09625.1 TetR/AcrR family transcriptional regulator [Vibrio ostreicida]